MKKIKLFIAFASLFFVSVSISSCAKKEVEENSSIYVWTEGDKRYYYAFDEKIFLDIIPNMIVVSFDENYLAEIQKLLQENTQILNMELANLGKCYIIYYYDKILTNHKT